MSIEFGYSREEIVYAMPEAAFGVHVLPPAANAMKVISTDFSMAQERMDRKEKGSSSLDFEKALAYNDKIKEEKELLSQVVARIKELEDKISELKP